MTTGSATKSLEGFENGFYDRNPKNSRIQQYVEGSRHIVKNNAFGSMW
jgi:hypothetical protein